MKIVSLSPDSFDHTGIETVEKNLLKALEESDIELEKVDYRAIKGDFPLSQTLDNLLRSRILASRIPEDADKILVPSQTRLNFNPEDVEAEVIVYVHDLFPNTHFFKFEEERSWMYRNCFSWIGHRISTAFMENLMKADKILTPSKYVKHDVVTHTPFSGEVYVVGQGVDNLPMVESPESREYDLLYVGSTLGRKNPEFLKAALELAQDNGFRVATVNHEKNDLPGETFTNITDEELAQLYSSSRFYLHPSYVEGFGRGPVEAQRYGSVPLAFPNPLNTEVLGEAYFQVDTPRQVCLYLRDHEPRETWRKKARANSRKYTWKKTRENFMEALMK